MGARWVLDWCNEGVRFGARWARIGLGIVLRWCFERLKVFATNQLGSMKRKCLILQLIISKVFYKKKITQTREIY
jgi:hypothetical protein